MKGPHLEKEKELFHQDNAPVHISVIAVAKINELKLELLPHALYSPVLATSNYFLFPKKAHLPTIISAVDGYFEELDGSHYKQILKLLNLAGKSVSS